MKIKQKTDYTKLPNPSDLAQTEKWAHVFAE